MLREDSEKFDMLFLILANASLRLPADLWLQAGRPPEIEFFQGERKPLSAGSITADEFHSFGQTALGEQGWQQVCIHDDNDVCSYYDHPRFGRFLIGSGSGRSDWKPLPCLRVRFVCANAA